VWIGRASYDLAAGNLFIVTTSGGTTDVRQLDRDLSAVPLDHDGILAFAEKDPDLAALLNANSGAAPGTASQGTPAEINLEAVLWIPTTLPDGDPVELEFTLTNHSGNGMYVLKWFTPLEGFGGEIFRVERDGQPIPYKGPLAARGDPTPDAYVFLDAGASVSAMVDLAVAYDFSEPGEYTIAFISPRISHVARTEGEMAASVDDLGPVAMPSNQVSVTILEDL
jgi:peptidyl-Lys metalloendopeptidase